MSEREISPLEDKLLSQAVANTETEIFRSAMDMSDPDESEEGDKSVEEMGEGLEGQHEAEVAEDDDEAEGEEDGADEGKGEEEPERDPKGRFTEPKPGKTEAEDKGHMVPKSRLTEEANKRREIEEGRKADQDRHAAEIAALNRRLDEILTRAQPQPQPAQVQPKAEPAAKPDMFTDPDGYEKWVLDQARTMATGEAANVFTQRFVEASMADAHDAHGEEFVKAYEDLTGINPVTQQVVRQVDKSDPVIKAEVARVLSAPNPGRALMTRYRQQATLREIGTDPAKYQERLRTETRESLMKDPDFRKEILASLKAEAAQGDNGRPRNVTRFPKSLSDASGGQSAQHRDPSDYDNSEEGVFDSVWSERRA